MSTDCTHAVDAGAYLLSALSAGEHAVFAGHLPGCEACQHEVEHLQIVVDTLPIAVPQLTPPPELRDRIMRVVDAEADLLRAAGPEADRVERRTKPRKRGWASGLFLRPAPAGALASVLLAVGVAGGVVLSGDDGPNTRTVAPQVAAAGSHSSVVLQGKRATLHLASFPSAPEGRVYQVWIRHKGGTPQPTRTLFSVRKGDGSAIIPIEEHVERSDEILVTDEPDGGRPKPTGATVFQATL